MNIHIIMAEKNCIQIKSEPGLLNEDFQFENRLIN